MPPLNLILMAEQLMQSSCADISAFFNKKICRAQLAVFLSTIHRKEELLIVLPVQYTVQRYIFILQVCLMEEWKCELCKPFRPGQCCEGLGSCLLMSPMFLPLCALPSYSDKSFGHLWFIFMSVEKCWFGNMYMTFKVWNIIG